MTRLRLSLALAAATLTGACGSPLDVAPTDATGSILLAGKAKADVCHRTGSDTNPWVLLSVSESAIQTHLERHGDALPGTVLDPSNRLDDACVVQPISGEGEGCPGGVNCGAHLPGGDTGGDLPDIGGPGDGPGGGLP